MAQERKDILIGAIKKILVVNLGGIGDVLLSTPALRALQRAYPDARLYLLVVPRVVEAVKRLPYVHKVFIFDTGARWYYAWRNFLELSRLRSERIDLAVNMRTLVSKESAAKMQALMLFVKPRIKAGRNTEGKGDFFDIRIPEEDVGVTYEMEYDLETVKSLGAAITDTRIDFYIDQASIRAVSDLLKQHGIDDTIAIIGIHPGGKPSHRWPAENFTRVLAELSKVSRARFVITGDKHEVALADRIIKSSNVNAVNLAGKLSLWQLGALLMRCSLYICNDTGAMHIAAFVGTPLVALFGPGYIERYDPRKISAGAIVLYERRDCAPCNKTDCATMRCLESISPGQVLNAAQTLLEQAQGRTHD